MDNKNQLIQPSEKAAYADPTIEVIMLNCSDVITGSPVIGEEDEFEDEF